VIDACQRLADGNTAMTNWLGHGAFGTAPHVLEVTPQKQVVWTFADHETMKTIATIQIRHGSLRQSATPCGRSSGTAEAGSRRSDSNRAESTAAG
jgi:hypothetical protein